MDIGGDTVEGSQASASWRGLAFRLGSEQLLVAADAVGEVLDPPEPLTRIPGAPAWIDGVAAIHGVITLVADLACLLAVGEVATGRGRRLLLVRAPGSAQVGLLVTEVLGTLELDAEPPPATTDPLPEANAALRTFSVPGGHTHRLLDVLTLLHSEAFRVAQG